MNPRLPCLLLGLSALGACAGIPDPPEGRAIATAADRHQISVEQSTQNLDIPVASGDRTLAPQEHAALAEFAGQYLRYGHGPLVLSTPAGGANESAAAMLARQARMSLSEAGLSHAAMTAATYDASGRDNAPIIVGFSRYEARAPECAPLWEQDLAHQSNNQPWESFGCATQANLAALIEDPHDLLAPRGETPRDSGRRDTVFQAYRAGEPTGATRSDDERARVSDAIE